MSLLLLFSGKRIGGHVYIEHPEREVIRKRKAHEAELAARQLAEGRGDILAHHRRQVGQ